MTAYHLAQLNIGRARTPLDEPTMAGFVAGLEEINALAEAAPGFVWRMMAAGGNDATAIRPFDDDDLLLINCSVWESVEALWDFVYRTDHLDYVRRRRDWFHRLGEAYQVLWWVPAGRVPDVGEALARLGHRRAHGPSGYAFTFHDRYPAPAEADPAEQAPLTT